MTLTRRTILALAVLLAGPGPAGAAPVDREALRDRLYERLAAAATEQEGRKAEDAIWWFWMEHPDPRVREAVALGMRQRESYEWDRALETFSGVVLADPDYAEGWNQRAFIHFLKEDFEASRSDLEKTLQLEPRHFGALAGMALILMQTGRFDEGQAVLRQAVSIHPFLKERLMLVEK